MRIESRAAPCDIDSHDLQQMLVEDNDIPVLSRSFKKPVVKWNVRKHSLHGIGVVAAGIFWFFLQKIRSVAWLC